MSDAPENKRILPRLKSLSPAGKNGNSLGKPAAARSPQNGKLEAESGSRGGSPPTAQGNTGEQQVVVVQSPPPTAEAHQNCWKRFLHDWPQGLQRQGVLMASWDEQIPFSSFLTTTDLVMFERRNPDTNGARRVLIGFDEIKAIKIVEVVRDEPFREAGFQGPEAVGVSK
ncbi:MAG: hypothetical protein MPJ50_04965 [Pirellulales bacterium]|nr:hypothetical protein [Pirellulales bacterium]